jgi:hypothetical protein
MAARNEHHGLGCATWVVLIYLAFAGDAWFDFTRINHDGLANVGLMMVTAPVALVGLLLSEGGGSELLPGGYGYLTDHAKYYVPAVAITALLLWSLARLIERRARKPHQPDDDPE